MIIEKFDFKNFFDPENAKNKNVKGYSWGIGAISIITPNQILTKYNSSSSDQEVKMPLGSGGHYENMLWMAESILGIPHKDYFGRRDHYSSEEEKLIQDFLKESIVIQYSNGVLKDILIRIPDTITSEQIKAMEIISNQLKELPYNDKKIYVYSNMTKDGDFVEEEDCLDETIAMSKKYVNDNYLFPYKEYNILDIEKMI